MFLEVARMLYSREKSKLKKAREKARLKKEMNKQLNAEITDESSQYNEEVDNTSLPLQKQNTVDSRNCNEIYTDPFDIKDSAFGLKNQTK